MKRLIFLALTVLGVLLVPALAPAQVYRWEDEQGGVHYSQGLYSVPTKYRAKAKPLDWTSPSPPPAPEKAETEKKPAAPGKPTQEAPGRQPAAPAEPEKKGTSG